MTVTKKQTTLTVSLEIQNNTDYVLEKLANEGNSLFYDVFPKKIPARSLVTVLFKSNKNIDVFVNYKSFEGNVAITIHKTPDEYESSINAIPRKDLETQVKITQNNGTRLKGTLLIAESLVIANMRNLYNFLNNLRDYITKRDQVVLGGSNLFDMITYNNARQVFNRRLQLKPFAIVYCECTEEVQKVYLDAINNNLPIRVRSGGHDHEGECSGTDVILIDLSRIDHVNVDNKGVASIGPGNRFVKLTTALATNEPPVMIPHGTCATVGIPGFTFGGGWGPWTRAKGMCCERLVGATIILGNGEIKELSEDGDKPSRELLWALRGGGGFSYGIVTELRIQTFPLPPEINRFDIEWNPFNENLEKIPTIDILTQWEAVINFNRDQTNPTFKESPNNQLIGTNLKVMAMNGPVDDDDFDVNKVFHNCTMFGYWEGTADELKAFVEASFGKEEGRYKFKITGFGGAGSEEPYGVHMMASDWDRFSFINVKRELAKQPLLGREQGQPLPPDFDAPAPHKITSRLVDKDGLKAEGHKALLRSLTSPLISNENRKEGLFSYVTLGAFSGLFYDNPENVKDLHSAFPYKDKQYTIQYQTWWNEDLSLKEELQDNPVYVHTNRALDWMQVSRDFDIPNTSGAFISFKDSSIPTKTYFAESYEELVRIKKEHSEDKFNHFRTRKTII